MAGIRDRFYEPLTLVAFVLVEGVCGKRPYGSWGLFNGGVRTRV